MDNEVTVGSQIKSVLLTHLYTALITLVFGLGAFWWFLAQDKWKQLYAVICSIIYLCVMYTKGEKIAKQDKRTVSVTRPYPMKGFVISLSITAVTLILWLLFRMTWSFMVIDGNIWGWSGVVYNAAFVVWTYFCNGLMNIDGGHIEGYMYIVLVLLPAVGLGLGYFAGYKGFLLTEYAAKNMYEKEDK